MTVYALLYGLFSALVLIAANTLIIRARKKRTTPAPVKTVDRYSPLPEPSDWLVELAEELTGNPGMGRDDDEYGLPPRSARIRGQTTALATTGETAQAVSARAGGGGPGSGAPGARGSLGRLLTVLMLGAFVAILNQTLINVAIPHMMNDLNVSANVVQWLVTGYMLVNGVMIPITAFLIERFGTRIMFILAMLLFTGGALICFVAPTFPVMLAGRLVQASGAGIIMPLMMTVFLTVFPPERRGMAMGMMGIAMIFAPAIGPTLSGWIVQTYTWRLLFAIVLPIGLLDLLLAWVWLGNVTRQKIVKFDGWGFLFSTIGFGGLLYAFSEAGSAGWGSGEVRITLIAGIVSLALFTWRELTVEEPMLDLRVFKYNIFTLTTIISMVINMAMFAAMILLPIYLQNIRGFTPLQSGLLLLPGAILMGIMQPVSGMIFDRIGARLLAVVGLIITTWTTWEFSRLTSDTTYGHILLLYCLRMFGMSFMMMTIMTEGMNQLPPRLHSHGTATSNTARQVAGSLGTALLVTVMTSRATMHMGQYSGSVTSANGFLIERISGLSHALSAAKGLPDAAGNLIVTQFMYGTAMKESTINGINDAFLIATGMTIVALILAFFIKRVVPAKKETKPAE